MSPPALQLSIAPLRRVARVAGTLLDFCYPGRCAHCERFCDAAGPLCESCHLRLDILIADPACPRCAKPVAEPGAPCPWCLGRGIFPFDTVIRLAEFSEPLRALILHTKYDGRWPLGEFLADRMLCEQRTLDLLRHIDCIAAVPLHIWRHFGRRFNQSEIIARRIARRMNIPFIRPLRRIRNTRQQTQLNSRNARQENVRGAFALRPRASRSITGQRLLLIDDVMTTGATIQSAARALRHAHPASISALVLAVADPRRRDFQSI